MNPVRVIAMLARCIFLNRGLDLVSVQVIEQVFASQAVQPKPHNRNCQSGKAE